MLWWKKDWAARTRQQYGSQFPFPLSLVLSYRKQWQVCQYLKAHGWHHKTEREVQRPKVKESMWVMLFYKLRLIKNWLLVQNSKIQLTCKQDHL